MPGYRACVLLCVAPLLLLCSSICEAQTFAAQGNLDCNGYSKAQRPLKAYLPCADFYSTAWGQRGYDNGHYIGHDEPSIGFV